MNKSISIVLPAFNEEENIKKAITSIDKHIKSRFHKHEIIVVNNGSRDKTKQIIEDLISKNKNIKIVNLSRNKGYGNGLRNGFKNAKYDFVFYTDSDNQFDIKEIDLLLPGLDKFDIICGFRKNRQDPKMRIFIASVYNLIIRSLFRLNIKDIDCSFKIYKKAVLKSMTLKSDTGLIDAEILIKAKKNGFTIGPQIPVTHFPRTLGRTTYEMGPRGNIIAFIKPGVIFEIFFEIKKLWKELS